MPVFDASDLTAVYGETLPPAIEEAKAHVVSVLSNRAGVHEVTFHANFSIDEDASLLAGSQITKGLLVKADPSLTLVAADAAWLPAQMHRGRTVYAIPENASVNVSDSQPQSLNASVGIFETRYVDDIGVDHKDTFLVVDAAPNSIVAPMHEQWLTSGVTTLGDVYKQLTKSVVEGLSVADHARELRNRVATSLLGESDAIYNDVMHNIYSDTSALFVANGLVKHEGNVLQRVSALGGFTEIQSPTRLFVPADTPVSISTFESWDALSKPHLRRIFEDCSWNGKEMFNTQVLSGTLWNAEQRKRAIEVYGSFTATQPWHMRTACFSSQGIRDVLSPSMLLKLTPAQAPTFAPAGARAGDTLSIPIDPSYEVFARVMSNPDSWGAWKPFNDAVLDGEYLRVPRSLIERI